MSKSKNTTYLTTPIYYVNDKPHIGHAYTTIAADVLARYYKMTGKKVFFLTGTDEHGAKIEKSAEKAGIDVQKLCDQNAEKFKQAWKALGINYDKFIRTTDKEHIKVVEDFFVKLRDAKTPLGNNAVYEGEYAGLYCTGCEAFYTEKDLVDGLCPDHKTKPEIVKEKNWFFKLSDFSQFLTDEITSNRLQVEPESKKSEILSLIKSGLQDIAISRPNVKWGIQVPFDKEQTIYVWVDALLNYISALDYPKGKLFKEFWPADVQLMAKDIIKFHAIIWPSMLKALDVELPKKVFAHGFFTIEGQKMSKSLGNAIDPIELANKYTADVLRYFLFCETPFGEDGDFSVKRLEEKYTSDLVNGLGNLVARVLGMIEKNPEIKIKKPTGQSLIKDLAKDVVVTTWMEIDSSINKLDFKAVTQAIVGIVNGANNCITKTEPFKLIKSGDFDEASKILSELLELIRHLAWLIRPFMPTTSDKIFSQLGILEIETQKTNKEAIIWGGLPEGIKIKKGEILFPRLEK